MSLVLWPAGRGVFLLEVDIRLMEGGEGMLELLIAIAFVLICLAIVLHEANKKN